MVWIFNICFKLLLQPSSLWTAWMTRLLSSWSLDLVAWLMRMRPSCRERGIPWGSLWLWWDTCSWMLRYNLLLLLKSNTSLVDTCPIKVIKRNYNYSSVLWKDNTAGTDNWLQVTVSHFSFHKPKQSHADVYLLSVVRFSRISGSTGQTDEWLNE